jgi:hypothetical protein
LLLELSACDEPLMVCAEAIVNWAMTRSRYKTLSSGNLR